MYNGKEQEGYIETRVRLYKNQSTKTDIDAPSVEVESNDNLSSSDD